MLAKSPRNTVYALGFVSLGVLLMTSLRVLNDVA
jgi:hypothetical protein